MAERVSTGPLDWACPDVDIVNDTRRSAIVLRSMARVGG
jgi:hypothetical protein